MSLDPGTTFGSYSVTAKIGDGGMGKVLASLNHPNMGGICFLLRVKGDMSWQR